MSRESAGVIHHVYRRYTGTVRRIVRQTGGAARSLCIHTDKYITSQDILSTRTQKNKEKNKEKGIGKKENEQLTISN
jgi:hypothetical protein